MPRLRFSAISPRFYGSLLVVAFIFLVLDIGALLLRCGMGNTHRRRKLGRAWLSFMARITVNYLIWSGILECNLQELAPLRQQKGLILVANHPSRLDSLILASALPHMTCVTKASIWERPTLGSTLRTAGYPRHDTLLRLLAPATTCLTEGGQLLLFPEGTRSRAGEAPGEFQAGFAAIAQRTRSAVQPLLIETTSLYLSQGWPFLKQPPLPMRYTVHVPPRFPAPARDESCGRALVEAVESLFKNSEKKSRVH